MNKYLTKKISLAALGLLLSICSFAQADSPEMADVMRSNGKIYVVVTVCLVILMGLFFYVMQVDRKLSKLEKDMRHQGMGDKSIDKI